MFVRAFFFWYMIIGSIVFPIIGYNMAKNRTIGGIVGAIIGFVLCFACLLIIILYPTTEEQATPRYRSVTDEIERYKHLLDDGAITWDEYKMKKRELLNL